MRIGARLVDHHHPHNHTSGSNGSNRVAYISNSKVTRKKRCIRKVKRHPPALQELFDACQGIFKGPGTVPPPEDVQRLSRILGESNRSFVRLSFWHLSTSSKTVSGSVKARSLPLYLRRIPVTIGPFGMLQMT